MWQADTLYGPYAAPKRHLHPHRAGAEFHKELRIGTLRSIIRQSKVALARRLRQETTLSLKWIAQRLHMGSWTYVSNLIHSQPSSVQCQALLPLLQ